MSSPTTSAPGLPMNATGMNRETTPSPLTLSLRTKLSDLAHKSNPILKFSKADLPQFLSLGHARLCWCHEHLAPISPTALPTMKQGREIDTEAYVLAPTLSALSRRNWTKTVGRFCYQKPYLANLRVRLC